MATAIIGPDNTKTTEQPPVSAAGTAPVDSDAEIAEAFSEGFADFAEGEPPKESQPTEPTPTGPSEQPVVAKEPEPEFIQLTKDDWTRTQQLITGLEAKLKRGLDDNYGRIGGLQQLVQQVRESNKSRKIKLTADDFPALKDEFPTLVGHLIEGLNAKLGEGVAGGAEPIDLEPIRAELKAEAEQRQQAELKIQKVEEERRQEAREALADTHEDWVDVVGLPGPNGEPPSETDFRKWVGTLPEQEQEKVWNSWNPRFLAKKITEFKNLNKAETERAAREVSAVTTRRNKLQASVTPRSAGGAGGGVRTLTTEREGFDSV